MVDRIVNVIAGPFHSSEVPDWDDVDDGFGLPYGEGFMLVVTMQDERGVLTTEELIFQDFDEALEMVNHFVDQIVPLEWSDNF